MHIWKALAIAGLLVIASAQPRFIVKHGRRYK